MFKLSSICFKNCKQSFDNSSLHVYKLCSSFTDYVLVKNKNDNNMVSKKELFCSVANYVFMSKNNNYACTIQDNLTSKDNPSNKLDPAKDRNKYTPGPGCSKTD